MVRTKSLLAATVFLWAAMAWASFTPIPVQRSEAEATLQTALDDAKDKDAKLQIAEKALADHPEDIVIGRMAQDVLMKVLDDPAGWFKSRAEGSESLTKRYLMARASGDSLTQIQTSEWMLSKDPKHYWALMMKATTLWTDDEKILDQVHGLFLQAIAAEPSRPEAYLNLGFLCSDRGQPADARDAFLAATIADPSDRLAKENLMTAYAALRDAAEYFKLADAVFAKEPLKFDLPLARSNMKLEARDFAGQVSVIEYWAYT